jgi:pimeloyl-ACP methyl ester carboxylesterase
MSRIAVVLLMASLLGGCASVPGEVGATPAAAAPAFASERITVRVEGQGPDVILIPGLSSSPTVWADTVRAHPGRRFHLVQLNGFAGAPVRGNAAGPVAAPVAEEIARYIESQGLKAPALIGHSMGGSIALMTAARHPARVGRVMVVDMLPWMGVMFGPPGATPDSVRPVADQILTAMSGPPSAQGEAMLQQTINSMIKTEARRAGALAESRASDPAVSARAFHELIVTDLRPELPRITAPVTVLYVRPPQAPMTDAQMEAGYQAAYAGLKGAQLKRIPDSWHFIMFDQPERFQAEVAAFLSAAR